MPASTEPRAALREWLAGGTPPPPGPPEHAEAVAAAAAAQGVAGLLDAALGAAPGWPEPVRAGLRAAHRAALVRGVRQLDLARRALGLLEQAGVRALPLKGAALAEALYDSVAERPMGDVDVLVLDDWPRATRALAEAGFVEDERADHAWSLADPLTGGVLELHHGLASCPRLFPVDADGLWSRSRPAAGQVPRVPSSEDLLVQLCLHMAFQHGLVLPLVHHLDILRLLSRTPPRPGPTLAIAEAARALAPLAAALEVARRLWDAPVPPELQQALRPRLPRGVHEWIRRSGPDDFLPPSRPAVARVRWGLARGRRRAWLAATLAPGAPGGVRAPLWQRGWQVARRAGALAWRWGPTILQGAASKPGAAAAGGRTGA